MYLEEVLWAKGKNENAYRHNSRNIMKKMMRHLNEMLHEEAMQEFYHLLYCWGNARKTVKACNLAKDKSL